MGYAKLLARRTKALPCHNQFISRNVKQKKDRGGRVLIIKRVPVK